ncbi:hypothetical protein D5086_012247 [Populus alba]|uniref:Uncharacterized protein n=1 Tax=Populus alba TaxID=43335 RepID=A0ACC4C378_POPAL
MVAQLSVLAKGRAQRPVENCSWSWAIRLQHSLAGTATEVGLSTAYLQETSIKMSRGDTYPGPISTLLNSEILGLVGGNSSPTISFTNDRGNHMRRENATKWKALKCIHPLVLALDRLSYYN